MNKLTVNGPHVVRADGSTLAREVLGSVSFRVDQADAKLDALMKEEGRKKLGYFLSLTGLLMLVSAVVYGTEGWPLGSATIPLSAVALLIGAVVLFKVFSIDRSENFCITIFAGPTEAELLKVTATETGRQWAVKVVQKLAQIENVTAGNWEIDGSDRSITQIP